MMVSKQLFNPADGKMYEGTKRLKAWPLKRGDYNTYRGWTLPEGENPDDAGYLVEYTDGGTPNDPRHGGYISWSPADVFERTYIEVAPDEHDAWHSREGRRMALEALARATPDDITDPPGGGTPND